VLERRYGVRLLDFLGNISTVLRPAYAERVATPRRRAADRRIRCRAAAHRADRSQVRRRPVGLWWSLVGVCVRRVRADAAAEAPLLLGGVFMVYQYAQQAGGVIVAIAANLQNFSQLRERGAHLQRRRNVVRRRSDQPRLADDPRASARFHQKCVRMARVPAPSTRSMPSRRRAYVFSLHIDVDPAGDGSSRRRCVKTPPSERRTPTRLSSASRGCALDAV
jgi:hypothetical protein